MTAAIIDDAVIRYDINSKIPKLEVMSIGLKATNLSGKKYMTVCQCSDY